MDDWSSLDEPAQRRLVLQAFKVIKGADFADADMREEQPTIAEFDAGTRNWVIGLTVASFLTGGLSLVGLIWVLPNHMRVKGLLKAHWREWLRSPDPECAHLVLVQDVRRILEGLPRSLKKQARGAGAELKRVSRLWSDLQKRLDRLETTAAEGGLRQLEVRKAEIGARLARETDQVTLTSLQNLQSSLDGQIDAAKNLAVWRTRLLTAQDECTESLQHLRSRLTLLAATGAAPDSAALTETTTALQELNTRLAATHDAAEEVLQLRV